MLTLSIFGFFSRLLYRLMSNFAFTYSTLGDKPNFIHLNFKIDFNKEGVFYFKNSKRTFKNDLEYQIILRLLSTINLNINSIKF